MYSSIFGRLFDCSVDERRAHKRMKIIHEKQLDASEEEEEVEETRFSNVDRAHN
jgi:hypothetical protein